MWNNRREIVFSQASHQTFSVQILGLWKNWKENVEKEIKRIFFFSRNTFIWFTVLFFLLLLSTSYTSIKHAQRTWLLKQNLIFMSFIFRYLCLFFFISPLIVLSVFGIRRLVCCFSFSSMMMVCSNTNINRNTFLCLVSIYLFWLSKYDMVRARYIIIIPLHVNRKENNSISSHKKWRNEWLNKQHLECISLTKHFTSLCWMKKKLFIPLFFLITLPFHLSNLFYAMQIILSDCSVAEWKWHTLLSYSSNWNKIINYDP